MASVIDICNMALSAIRGGSINSLTESSLQAQQCKLHYPYVRDMALADTTWGFSHRLEPASLLDTTIFGWAYVYAYPNDCLHINKLVLNYTNVVTPGSGVTRPRRIEDYLGSPDLDAQIKFKIYNLDGKRVIAANEPELRIDYRSRVDDPTIYSPQFIMALAKLLASEIAIPIVGVDSGRPMRSDELKLYQAYIAAAASKDLNEQYSEPIDSDFISVRD